MDLQLPIDLLYLPETTLSLSEFNNLLQSCVNANEFAATVFVYDKMRANKVTPSNQTFTIMEKLHSKTLKENNNIVLKEDIIKKLAPRRRIHKIIKGFHYSTNYKKALEHKETVREYLDKNPLVACIKDRHKLAKQISKQCHLEVKTVRYIITHLKKTNYFTPLNI